MKGANVPIVQGSDSRERWTIGPARYAKGMVSVHVSNIDKEHWMKGRLARIATRFGRYSGRENSYIMSPSQMSKMLALFTSGGDYSPITGKTDSGSSGLNLPQRRLRGWS
jgi:hypothetical protein